jgi:hypothetical protein
MAKNPAISEPTNGAKLAIETEIPYIVHVKIVGTSDLLLHAWNCESVEAKGRAKKGSEAKKTDDVESYVRRNTDGLICLPAEYVRMSTVNAAKFRQDPRSPRKSAMDLFKAGVVSLSPLSPIVNNEGNTTNEWDFLHKCRVQIQRNGITRTRPAFHEGWSAELSLMVNLPGYIPPSDLLETLTMAGKVVGVGDFRPSYGRFQVVNYEVQQD